MLRNIQIIKMEIIFANVAHILIYTFWASCADFSELMTLAFEKIKFLEGAEKIL